MKLSVIIPTHNRAATLLMTLAAIEQQTISRGDFEVIVVDDGSNEQSLQKIRKYKLPYAYKLLEKTRGGLASARNLGADHAVGETLYFLDDDVIPGIDTLRQHLNSHRSKSVPIVVVGSLPYSEKIQRNSFLWYLEKSGHYDLYQNPRKYPEGRPPLPPLNGNSSISRDFFLTIGRYDESFSQYGGEDLELGYRLAKAGVEFIYNPMAIGFHHHSKNFAQFCMDMEKAGESLIWVYGKHPEIKAAKKIDIMEDTLSTLPVKKKIIKLILSLTMNSPWLLKLPRAMLLAGESSYALRHLMFPFYRWVSHYHYAVGMRKGLAVGK